VNRTVLTGSASNKLCIAHASSRVFEGKIAEVLVYSATQTAEEKTETDSYLSDKYGIT
jgi:hypothetical protein